jgi:dienelactone hydrolase
MGFKSFALLVVAGLLAMQAGAQTAWPVFMPRLQAAVSESTVTAVLPGGGVSVLPDPALPPERSSWHGLWTGWACANRLCDVRLAVEQVSQTQATLAFAMASPLDALLTERATGQFVGDELQVPFGSGARLVLRRRPDGDMELTYWRSEKLLLYAGVLTQKMPESTYTRSVERIPTPWNEGGVPQTLEMVVYRPHGPGPYPVVVFNHGSTGRGDQAAWFKLTWTSPELAQYFASQGWLVLFPQRRGRGQSDGLYDEGFSADRTQGYSCNAEPALKGFERAVEDLDAVMTHVLQRPDVDSQRMLIGGVSRGGILSVAYAGRHPERFRGVVNFVGGWVGDACPEASVINTALMRHGGRFKLPMFWMYGDRDPYYKLSHSRANHEAFITSGGLGEFFALEPPSGRNGHMLHIEPTVWSAHMKRYLRGLSGR